VTVSFFFVLVLLLTPLPLASHNFNEYLNDVEHAIQTPLLASFYGDEMLNNRIFLFPFACLSARLLMVVYLPASTHKRIQIERFK
jgi:hypothetical protein